MKTLRFKSTVPDYFIWLRYLSWFNYGFEDLMINQWKDYPGTICKLEELLSFDYYGYDDLITVRVDENCRFNDIVFIAACDVKNSTRTPCLTTGEMILERYQLHEVDIEFLAVLVIDVNLYISSPHSSDISVKSIIYTVFLASSAGISLNRRELI
jgi:hypothetical protein